MIKEVASIPLHVSQLDSIGNETRQTRQRVSSHQQSHVGVDGPRRGAKSCIMQSTRIHNNLGRDARLPRLMILVSRRWSRSCIIFLRPQRCCRFDVLPDSRYPRYTREMVVRENPNSVATLEIAASHLSCADYNITFILT
ncbi:uncharacterized protein TNCV_3102491 [Trichonephila clavipes]|nr:uncharacterized protein TNCV_3102491 [Trichonephila clavipes]